MCIPKAAAPASRSNPAGVLYISRHANFYGGGKCLCALLGRLDRTRFTPRVVAPPAADYAPELQALGVSLHELDTAVRWSLRGLGRLIRVNAELIRLVRDGRIRLVHFNEESCFIESLIPFLLYCRLRRIPYIVHDRSAGNVFGALKRFLFFRGHVICISQAVHRELTAPRRSDLLTRPRRERISLLYDGIDTRRFAPADGARSTRREFGLDGEVLIGYVSAIDPRKRQEIFLRAAKSVRDVHPGVKFMIVGDLYDPQSPPLRSYKERLLSLRDQLGLSRDVIFTGYRRDVPRLLGAMDICVLSSYAEGLGDVVIEAMAAGVPVVSSASGGPAELVEEGLSGFLIADDANPQAYAEKLSLLVEDRPRRERMGLSALARAGRFDIKEHVRQVEALYDRLLDSAR